MAGLINTAIRRLLPKGRAWNLTGNASNVLDGISDSLCRPRLFIKGVLSESIPATATETIDQWLDLLGISVAEGTTLGEKRAIAQAEINALGGQDLEYVSRIVTGVFPDVYIDEDEAGTGAGPFLQRYYVRGFYSFSSEFNKLSSILKRIAPLYLDPIFETRSVYDGDVARCGIGSTGRAICGRRETAYRETDGQVGRAGVGVAGEAVTGRVPA